MLYCCHLIVHFFHLSECYCVVASILFYFILLLNADIYLFYLCLVTFCVELADIFVISSLRTNG